VPTDRESNLVVDVSPGLDLVVLSDDEVLVQFGTRSLPSELIRDTDLTGVLGKLIGRLQADGPALLDDLVAAIPTDKRADARSAIDDLLSRGFLAREGSNPVEQYLRFTLTGETSLSAYRISLIGCGPIGVLVAEALVQHGIGGLYLLDPRPTDQIWRAYCTGSPTDASQGPAHLALETRLRNAGYSNVSAATDEKLETASIGQAVLSADLVVVTLEQPELRTCHVVNRHCIRQETPWLLATIDGNHGLVGPLFVPGHTACYNCYQSLAWAATPSPVMAQRYRQHLLQRGASSFFAGLPGFAQLVAGYTSLATVHFLLRQTSFALGTVVALELNDMTVDIEKVLKLPRCPVCGAVGSPPSPPFSGEVVTRYEALATKQASSSSDHGRVDQ
jgi:bacteriocin biosynthesis cyclodehydratase domain-containing protein